jgi:hypothetical protein
MYAHDNNGSGGNFADHQEIVETNINETNIEHTQSIFPLSPTDLTGWADTSVRPKINCNLSPALRLPFTAANNLQPAK